MAFAAAPQLGARWDACAMQRRQRAAAAAVSQRGAPGARRCTLVVRAAGDSGSAGAKGRTIELPIFPLNVVALPHATVPLMIFEPRCAPLWRCGVARCRALHAYAAPSRRGPGCSTCCINTPSASRITHPPSTPPPHTPPRRRYRVLFNTLMDGAQDIEEGLVQKDSPYAGTRRFGMCYVDGSTGRMAT